MGPREGNRVGRVGVKVAAVGARVVGDAVEGPIVGEFEGTLVVGKLLEPSVGSRDGKLKGLKEGLKDGTLDGFSVGGLDGVVGITDGSYVGFVDG